MIIPQVNNYDNKVNKIELKLNDPGELHPSYYILSDKDKFRLIKEVENIVRGSLEYKQFISFLRNEVDMTSCAFYQRMNNKSGKISIEIHHYPFTLFDIVVTIIEKYESEELELNPLMIAEEVMMLHYTNQVGLMPLSKTVHQLVHDGKLFIPLQFVYGEYSKFVANYDKWIPEPIMDSLKVLVGMSKDPANMDFTILEPKYIYVEVEGFKIPEPIVREKKKSA